MNKNKIEHIWTVLCSSSTTDQETNNISLINALEELRVASDAFAKESDIAEKGLVVPIAFELITLWKRTEEGREDISIDAELEITDPNNKSVGKYLFPIKIKTGTERSRVRLRFPNMKVTMPGEYLFTIKLKDGKGSFHKATQTYLQIKFALVKK